MVHKKKLHQDIKFKLKQFCKHCTLHGVYYFYSNTSWSVHAVWCVILASSASLCVYLSHMIWGKFSDNPTFTVVESTHYPIDYIPFPAVSVCDSEAIYGPSAGNITQILELRGFSERSISKFYDSFTDIKTKDYVPDENTKKMHSVLEDLGYNYDVLINLLKKPCEVLIQECVWRSRLVDCSIMFRDVFTALGHCCQFDLQYFRKNADKDTNFHTGTEMSEALDIIVNTHKVLSDGSFNESFVSMSAEIFSKADTKTVTYLPRFTHTLLNTLRGLDMMWDGICDTKVTIYTEQVTCLTAIKLYVFDKHDNLTLLDSAITLTPATYFDVMVGAWLIDSSDDVKALSLANRKCFLANDIHTIAHSYQACMTALMMRKVVEQCHCIPFNYYSQELIAKDYPECSWERLACVYPTLGYVQNDIRDIISQHECFQKCDYVEYTTEAEYVRVDRVIEEKVNGSCRVAVHFNDNTCIKYRREVLYTWDQMLANLGGIFGLCLGGSIISVIEIIWFLFELLFTIIQRKIFNKRAACKKNYVTPKKIRLYPYLN